MASFTYAVSFRIAFDSTYFDRWSSTIDAVRAQADRGATWEELTSQILFRSSKSADGIARDIYLGSKFDVTRDGLLVINHSDGTFATRGKIDNPATLASILGSGNNALRGLLFS